jgi:hypothetical protein
MRQTVFRQQIESAPEKMWIGTWGPLQPTRAERRFDPRVVAVRGDEVVVNYRTRALSPSGARFESEVLGLYEVEGWQVRPRPNVPLRYRSPHRVS